MWVRLKVVRAICVCVIYKKVVHAVLCDCRVGESQSIPGDREKGSLEGEKCGTIFGGWHDECSDVD